MRITWEEMNLERGGKGLLEPSEGRKKEKSITVRRKAKKQEKSMDEIKK